MLIKHDISGLPTDEKSGPQEQMDSVHTRIRLDVMQEILVETD